MCTHMCTHVHTCASLALPALGSAHRLHSAHAIPCSPGSVLTSALLGVPALSFSSAGLRPNSQEPEASALEQGPNPLPALAGCGLGDLPWRWDQTASALCLVIAGDQAVFELLVLTALSLMHIKHGRRIALPPEHPTQTCTLIHSTHEPQLRPVDPHLWVAQLSHFSPGGFETPPTTDSH